MEADPVPDSSQEMVPQAFTLMRMLAYFTRLGTFGFGGPIALVGYMERDLVVARAWITKEQYLRGLAVAQLAPGPLAAQLAMYIGYLQGGVIGSALAGVAFVLPSFLMVLALGYVYVEFGGLSWMQSAFYGIGAAVIGILIKSAHKLIKMTLKKDRLLWAIFAVLLTVTAVTEKEIAWLFLLGGFVTLAASGFKPSKPEAFAAAPLGLGLAQGAASGAIAGAVIVLGRRSVFDIPTALIALAAFLVVFRTKFPDPILIAFAGLLGWGLHHFGIGG